MDYNIDLNFPKDIPVEIYTSEGELLSTVTTQTELLYITNQIRSQKLEGFYIKFKDLEIRITKDGTLESTPEEMFYNYRKIINETMYGIPIEEYNKVKIEVDENGVLTEVYYKGNFYAKYLSRMSKDSFTIKTYPEWMDVMTSTEMEGTTQRKILEELSNGTSFTTICNLLLSNENNVQE